MLQAACKVGLNCWGGTAPAAAEWVALTAVLLGVSTADVGQGELVCSGGVCGGIGLALLSLRDGPMLPELWETPTLADPRGDAFDAVAAAEAGRLS